MKKFFGRGYGFSGLLLLLIVYLILCGKPEKQNHKKSEYDPKVLFLEAKSFLNELLPEYLPDCDTSILNKYAYPGAKLKSNDFKGKDTVRVGRLTRTELLDGNVERIRNPQGDTIPIAQISLLCIFEKDTWRIGARMGKKDGNWYVTSLAVVSTEGEVYQDVSKRK